jgi:endoglucanase
MRFAARIFVGKGRGLSLAAIFIGLAVAASSAQMHAQGTGFWHTGGNRILDSNGQQVRIAGINWYGFETPDRVVHGLTSQDYRTILQTVKAQGYNTVRIPFSNQMIELPNTHLNIRYENVLGSMNLDLQRQDSLGVLDRIVAYAGSIGLKIILDNHRSSAGDGPEQSGLWYTADYPESAWIADWVTLAKRYRNDSAVIGFDLRNEPHNAEHGGACWDCGGANDWHLAAERAGNAILAANPNVLIFVEGVDTYRQDRYWWGGNLEGVAKSPVVLTKPNRVVYSPHEYGPRESSQPWFTAATTYDSLSAVWTQHWAYISNNGIAPVWLGEFGTTNNSADILGSTPGTEGQWFQSLVQFLATDRNLNWTFWALNGEDSYGLLNSNYDPSSANRLKQNMMAKIQSPLPSRSPVRTSSVSAGVAAPTLLPVRYTPR